MSRQIETTNIAWHGITIAVSYEANWLNIGEAPGRCDVAHLQVETLAPEGARLPITETGYRSHFTSSTTIDEFGGPVAFVEAWLEEEGQRPQWRLWQDQSRQRTLF